MPYTTMTGPKAYRKSSTGASKGKALGLAKGKRRMLKPKVAPKAKAGRGMRLF